MVNRGVKFLTEKGQGKKKRTPVEGSFFILLKIIYCLADKRQWGTDRNICTAVRHINHSFLNHRSLNYTLLHRN